MNKKLAILIILVIPSIAWGEQVKLTFYANDPRCIGEFFDGFTATGVRADWRLNICAVSSRPEDRLFPLHSIILVPGYGILVVEDVGGGIGKNHLDILVEDYETAIGMGVIRVDLGKILVISKGR